MGGWGGGRGGRGGGGRNYFVVFQGMFSHVKDVVNVVMEQTEWFCLNHRKLMIKNYREEENMIIINKNG